ncbi:ATP-binding cassette domain-containing protein [Paraburkholderia humisilvae]|uniref:ATP-binding cassette domain-containing protein n=1 Tax=Paraburkholderia humisilvae TaxID=627669 RepID=UPI001C2E64CB|nr:ATP-binding cassette domain-containing protein [Paraburkholderia humisilvae]
MKKSFGFRKMSRDHAHSLLNAEVRLGRQPIEVATPLDPKSSDEILLETCRLIGQREGILFKAPFANANQAATPLDRILRASNVRAQAVVLPQGWWKSDNGNFLAQRAADAAPLALIFRRGKYQEYDLRSGRRRIVSAANVHEIGAQAHSFFTPLPKGTVRPLALLRYALAFTWRDVIFFFVLGLTGALLQLVIPWASGEIFDKIVPGDSYRDLWTIGTLLLTLVCVLGVIELARSIAVLRFEGRASYKLQGAVLDRLLTIKTQFFSEYDPGNLAERALGIEKIRTVLSANVMSALVSLQFSLLNFALMLYYDVWLAVLALALGTVVAAFTLTISILAYKYVAGYMRMEAVISGFLMMMMRGIQKIRMTGASDKVFDIWAERFAQQKHHYIGKQRLLIAAEIFTFAFPIFASICIYLRVYHLMTAPVRTFQFGDFVGFNSAYLTFQGALINAFMVTVPLISLKPAYDMMLPIFKANTEDYEGKRDIGELNGDIEITGVNFRYKNAPDLTLRNVNVKVSAGEFVALVGGSGSGKSSLFRLLLGFEQCESGAILFDDVDMQTIDLRTLRDQMGVVLQDGRILEGTVLSNIIGGTTRSEADAWEAARLAGCERHIKGLDNGMHTHLSANSSMLSGGQKQLILIARALVKRPKVLLLDEATSAVDNVTQTVISEHINSMKITRIVIAHRLSTIKAADRVIVMDRGSVVEQGTYNELIEKRGSFYDLAKTQIE